MQKFLDQLFGVVESRLAPTLAGNLHRSLHKIIGVFAAHLDIGARLQEFEFIHGI